MADQASTPSYRALLIGINAYREKPLEGCVRDVLEINKHLENIQGCHVQVDVLTASADPIATPSQLADESRCWPTHSRVIESMTRIVSQSQAGDFVYIHFSGHGTTFAPPPPTSPGRKFANPSTGDLALNLLSEDGTGVQYLRGGELAKVLTDMTDKKLIVTLVLDCCFSGSIVRDDASVRYLDYDAKVDKAYPLVSGQTLSSQDELRQPAYRNASLGPNWLVNPTNYTVITACGPTEKAREIKIGDDITHGAMTYFLCDIFKELGGIGGKHLYLHQCLRAKLLNAQPEKPLNQNPMWYGNKNLNFLGRANALTEAVPIPLVRHSTGEVRLGAGRAHGICEDDELAIRAVGFDTFTQMRFVTHETLFTTQVASVWPLTSSLKLSEMPFQSGAVFAATILTNLSLKEKSIRLDIGTPVPQGWSNALNRNQALDIFSASKDIQDREDSLIIILTDQGDYEIHNVAGGTPLRLDTLPDDPGQRAALVLQTAEHLAKYQLVRDLNNGTGANPDPRFRKSFEIQLIGPDPAGERYNPGCQETKNHHTVCSHSKCVIEVDDGDCLRLELKNREEPGGTSFCVHVLDLGPAWEISNLLEGDYEVVPPRCSNVTNHFAEGTGGLWEYEVAMEVPPVLQDRGECEDIIKIFVTSQPTSLLTFELPELDQVLLKKDVPEYRGPESGLEIGNRFSEAEDWVAVSFRIRTRIGS